MNLPVVPTPFPVAIVNLPQQKHDCIMLLKDFVSGNPNIVISDENKIELMDELKVYLDYCKEALRAILNFQNHL